MLNTSNIIHFLESLNEKVRLFLHACHMMFDCIIMIKQYLQTISAFTHPLLGSYYFLAHGGRGAGGNGEDRVKIID